ncbi:hypothetical protein K0H71_17950 [Bacillus sp. IITD106]|nr:hypothetical protein [Bacillus sp. IITD106]
MKSQFSVLVGELAFWYLTGFQELLLIKSDLCWLNYPIPVNCPNGAFKEPVYAGYRRSLSD